jgi:glucans biosynthesis protein
MQKTRNERGAHGIATTVAVLVSIASGLSCHPSPRTGLAPAAPSPPPTVGTDDPSASPTRSALAAPTTDAPPAYFSTLIERARALSLDQPRKAAKAELPPELREIRYDAYRSIRFRPERSLWRGHQGEFEVQFFHPGFYYQDTVSLFELGPGGAQALPFSTQLFSYDGVKAPGPEARLEYTGFRLHSFLNRPDYRDEVMVFQGASYFRVLGQGNAYGLSARGLAINLGEPTPEEFPRFTEFYLTEPGPGQRHAWVLALLESQTATAAYAFRIEPGTVSAGAPPKGVLSIVDVEAHVFLRDTTLKLGLAPLTSMYLFGEDEPNRFGDFRPEVHDSDGLSLWLEGGEWLYRPLRNPGKTSVCSFRADRLRGFGLLQRDRDFSSYQDLEARYEARPSVWVEPIAGFDEGSLRLLEIATRLETDDNIALAFVPEELDAREVHLRYRLHVGSSSRQAPPGDVVRATRLQRTEKGTRFLVDFARGAEPRDAEPRGAEAQEPVTLSLTAGEAHILEQHLEVHPHIGGYRVSFELERPSQPKAVELRAFLHRGSRAASETWSYLWQTSP